jgi:hypothetical protein
MVCSRFACKLGDASGYSSSKVAADPDLPLSGATPSEPGKRKVCPKESPKRLGDVPDATIGSAEFGGLTGFDPSVLFFLVGFAAVTTVVGDLE